MRQGLDVLQRINPLARLNEMARGAICVVLLVVFWFAELQIVFVVLLPIAVYAGLWLLTGPSRFNDAMRGPSAREIGERYTDCLRIQRHIVELSTAIPDPKTFAIVNGISDRIEQILDVISEDANYVVCQALLDPLRITDQFLSHYIKLIRRGHDAAEMKERVRENLSALDQGFAKFADELNLEAVVDLEKLGGSINDWVKELPVPPDAPGLPPELRADVTRSHPPHIALLIDSLTPRQISILRILTTGRTDQEIADMLFIAKRTVTTHIGDIYEKINVRNRAEAVAFAVRWGLMPPDEPEQDRDARFT